MPSGSVTKIGHTYKKWTYIARKQNIQLTRKQHISQNVTVQYKTTKHENNEKATAGNWTRAVKPVAQRYRMSYPDPVSNSGIINQTPRDSNPRSSFL
jgi:hypothetical protein